MGNIQRYLNILWVLIVCAALLTANWFQIVERRSPCSFCMFQRVAMAGLGLSAMMNLRFGPRVEQYACSILFALLGLMVSYRLIPFGPLFMGYHLSTLSSMVFVGSIAAEAFLLLLYSQAKHPNGQSRWGRIENFLFLILTALVSSSIITPLLQ